MSARSELENDISKWRRSGYKCPACHRLLWSLPMEDSILFWCGVGTCPSLAANNGASTIEELRKNVEEEPEYKESGDWP